MTVNQAPTLGKSSEALDQEITQLILISEANMWPGQLVGTFSTLLDSAPRFIPTLPTVAP